MLFWGWVTVLFFLDYWRDNQHELLVNKFSRLFSFAKDTQISVHEVLQTDELLALFHLPLSTEAFGEFQLLIQIVLDYQDRDNTTDVWSWGFGKGGPYTARKYYKQVHDPNISNPFLSWIWKSCCTLKIKTFAWLVIMDRINTKDMILRRHGTLKMDHIVYYAELIL